MEFITLFGTPKKKEPTVFEKIKAAVKQTKENFTEQIQDLVEGQKEIDADMLEQLEAIMIGADIGVTTTNDILKTIKDRMSRKTLQDPKELRGAIKEELRKILTVNYTPPKEIPEGNPFVILMVGVNGVGKTTILRLIGAPTPKAEQILKRVLKDQNANGTFTTVETETEDFD